MKIYKLSALLLVFIGGCAPEVSDWTPAQSPKENKVNRAVFTHMIHYPAHASSMDEREKKCLLQFLKKTVLSPHAVTVILEEYGGHSKKRLKDIERELLRFGIPYELITEDYDQDECPPQQHCYQYHKKYSGSGVEIIIERYVVIPPACADFSQMIGDAKQAQQPSNFGCSDITNLGMMIANPRDLIRGRTLGDSDGTVIAAGVERYRKDKVKELMETSTTVAPGTTATNTSTVTPGAVPLGTY